MKAPNKAAIFVVSDGQNPVTTNEYDLHIRKCSSSKGRGQMRTDAYFRLPPTMWDQATEYARAQKCEVSKVYRHALAEYLERRGINPLQPIGCK